MTKKTKLNKFKQAASKPDDKEQSHLFIETAHEIGADEDVSGADKLIGNLAKMKPEPRKPLRNKGNSE